MIIVIPKEVKNNENRVSILPFRVEELSKCVHQIIIQSQAKIGSVFADAIYRDMGANIAGTPEEIYQQADIVIQAKEPQPEDVII